MSLDGSARRNKEEGETAGWRRQQFQVRRVLAVRPCVLFVRVSIRLEQTEHRAVNLLKEVESVNASEREGERASKAGGMREGSSH